jgi:hypothetical protein
MEPRLLNWSPRHDHRSKNFAIADIVPSDVRKNVLWGTGPILDQGKEGACVGFGWTAQLLSTPEPVNLALTAAAVPHDPTQFALSLYHTAQTLDDQPGENYSGTSVLAGAKAVTNLGFLKEYHWAFNVDDVINALIHVGPVVLGIEWHEGMYEAPAGQLTVSGPVVGGHCITAVGYRDAASSISGKEAIILQNSWGRDWGMGGLGQITKDDLASLLANGGEACVPTKRG